VLNGGIAHAPKHTTSKTSFVFPTLAVVIVCIHGCVCTDMQTSHVGGGMNRKAGRTALNAKPRESKCAAPIASRPANPTFSKGSLPMARSLTHAGRSRRSNLGTLLVYESEKDQSQG
jgi:hypothetical protein